MSEGKKRKTYKCDICGAEFDKKSLLEVHRKFHEKRSEVVFHGLGIRQGDCLRVIFSRFSYVIKVEDLTENPNVVLAHDIYGHKLTLNLSKALMVQKITEEEYERRKKYVEATKATKA